MRTYALLCLKGSRADQETETDIFSDYDVEFYFRDVRPFLEGHIGLEHNWTANPNKHGRWLKKLVAPDQWAEIEGTFAGPSADGTWTALFRTAGLFRRLAMEVGVALGYDYPSGMDERITAYMLRIRELPRSATELPG